MITNVFSNKRQGDSPQCPSRSNQSSHPCTWSTGSTRASRVIVILQVTLKYVDFNRQQWKKSGHCPCSPLKNWEGYVCMHGCMYACMHACMDVWMYGCMDVCMYIYIYVCMYAWMDGCMHACMYACMHVCMHGCMHGCMHACMYACMHACVSVCLFVCLSVCLSVCMYACMDVCMHACMSACLPAWLPAWLSVCMYICVHNYHYTCRTCVSGVWLELIGYLQWPETMGHSGYPNLDNSKCEGSNVNPDFKNLADTWAKNLSATNMYPQLNSPVVYCITKV